MDAANNGPGNQSHPGANGNAFAGMMAIIVADHPANDTPDHSATHGTVNGTGTLSERHPGHQHGHRN